MSKWLRASLVCAVIAGFLAAVIVTLAVGHLGKGPSLDESEAALTSAVAGAFVFVAVYSIREPWWANWIGRFIISHILAVACLLLPFVLSFFFDFNRFDNVIASWILIIMFYVVAADLLLGTILWLHTSMVRAQERRAAEAAERLQTQRDPEP